MPLTHLLRAKTGEKVPQHITSQGEVYNRWTKEEKHIPYGFNAVAVDHDERFSAATSVS